MSPLNLTQNAAGRSNAGLMDLQVNGFAGVDFNDAKLTSQALDHALHAMLCTGVTTCLPTLITAPEPQLAERLAALDRAVADSVFGPLMVPGYHLEGPFLNPGAGFAGCHPPEAMLTPDLPLLQRLTTGLRRPLLLLTLAPERPGAAAVISWAKTRGILVAMGHSAADQAAVQQAAALGVQLSTHLGNALPHMIHKFHSPLMAQLAEDRLAASFIADGIHVPRPALRVLLRAKGMQRSLLVTDATAAAAAPPGHYAFAGADIERAPDGSVRVPGEAMLAGSSLCLDQAVRNVIAWDIADAGDALRLAGDNPAALLAPSLARHGITLPPRSVFWSTGLHPVSVRLADHEIRMSAARA